MRWWASALAIVAACTRPPASPTPRACTAIAPTCRAVPDDPTAFAFVQTHCWKCHAEHGIAEREFTTIPSLRAAPVAAMLGGCEMPPDGERALDDADRRMLIEWASCAR